MNTLSMTHPQSFFEISTDAMFITNIHGDIMQCNPAAASLFGYIDDELLNQSLDLLIPRQFQSIHQTYIKKYHSVSLSHPIEDMYPRRKDGSEFPAVISLSHNKERQEILVIIIDVSERKQIEEQRLERERSKLIANFITQASHEFRTPLTIIGTSTYLLNKLAKGENLHQHIQTIQEQVNNITSLVNSLNTLSTLDCGKPLNYSIANLNDLVLLALSKVKHTAFNTKNHTFIVKTAPDVPDMVLDVQYIQLAIREVLRNAIIYTPENGTITLKTLVSGDNAHIEIHDTGIGIPDNELTHIFKRFYRTELPNFISGFGLGLPMSKTIIERHNGTLSVRSNQGEGSTFIITLPISESKP